MKQTEVNNMNELTLDKFNERMEPIEAFMNTNDIGYYCNPSSRTRSFRNRNR